MFSITKIQNFQEHDGLDQYSILFRITGDGREIEFIYIISKAYLESYLKSEDNIDLYFEQIAKKHLDNLIVSSKSILGITRYRFIFDIGISRDNFTDTFIGLDSEEYENMKTATFYYKKPSDINAVLLNDGKIEPF